jgi:hypothetical protein
MDARYERGVWVIDAVEVRLPFGWQVDGPYGPEIPNPRGKKEPKEPKPAHRPRKGADQPYEEMGLLVRIFQLDDAGQEDLNRLLHYDRSVNLELLAEQVGVSRMTLNRYRKKGEALSATQLDRIEATQHAMWGELQALRREWFPTPTEEASNYTRMAALLPEDSEDTESD